MHIYSVSRHLLFGYLDNLIIAVVCSVCMYVLLLDLDEEQIACII